MPAFLSMSALASTVHSTTMGHNDEGTLTSYKLFLGHVPLECIIPLPLLSPHV